MESHKEDQKDSSQTLGNDSQVTPAIESRKIALKHISSELSKSSSAISRKPKESQRGDFRDMRRATSLTYRTRTASCPSRGQKGEIMRASSVSLPHRVEKRKPEGKQQKQRLMGIQEGKPLEVLQQVQQTQQIQNAHQAQKREAIENPQHLQPLHQSQPTEPVRELRKITLPLRPRPPQRFAYCFWCDKISHKYDGPGTECNRCDRSIDMVMEERRGGKRSRGLDMVECCGCGFCEIIETARLNPECERCDKVFCGKCWGLVEVEV